MLVSNCDHAEKDSKRLMTSGADLLIVLRNALFFSGVGMNQNLFLDKNTNQCEACRYSLRRYKQWLCCI